MAKKKEEAKIEEKEEAKTEEKTSDTQTDETEEGNGDAGSVTETGAPGAEVNQEEVLDWLLGAGKKEAEEALKILEDGGSELSRRGRSQVTLAFRAYFDKVNSILPRQ